ncbi:MAG: ABC transporter ATP-binding protein [Actinomycetota bacterium]
MSARLAVEHLRVSYGGLLAVDDVSITVAPGTVHSVIGPNGAGKTTLIDAISGFVVGATGRVVLDGRPIEGLPPHGRARAGLVRTFQSIELFDDLDVRENLLVAAARPRWWSPIVDAVAPRRGLRGLDVDFALEALGLTDVAAARPGELSHGRRRLAGVARAIVSRPRLVLLDEPAAGLDADETAALGRVIRSLPGLGIGVLLVDHDMGLVLGTSDAVTVIDFGQVIASGSPAEVRDDPAVIAAYLGSAT